MGVVQRKGEEKRGLLGQDWTVVFVICLHWGHVHSTQEFYPVNASVTAGAEVKGIPKACALKHVPQVLSPWTNLQIAGIRPRRACLFRVVPGKVAVNCRQKKYLPKSQDKSSFISPDNPFLTTKADLADIYLLPKSPGQPSAQPCVTLHTPWLSSHL